MSQGTNMASEAVGKRAEPIRLGDQLDQQDQLLEILFHKVQELGKILDPILIQEKDGGMEEDSSDVGPVLSPYQARLMSQYYSVNNIIGKLENISRRVQL